MIERETVETWLAQEGLEHEETEIEEPPGYRWALAFQGQVYQTVVVHPDVDWNHLMMQVSVNISDNHRSTLRELDPDTRDRFMYDLRIALLEKPVGYQLVLDDGEPEILEEMVFGYNLYEDPLQKAGFLRRNHQLQTTALLGVQMIRKLDRFKEW